MGTVPEKLQMPSTSLGHFLPILFPIFISLVFIFIFTRQCIPFFLSFFLSFFFSAQALQLCPRQNAAGIRKMKQLSPIDRDSQ